MSELLLGVSLGWAAGLSPGPLTALIVTSTLRSGTAAGLKVALAPLLSDAPADVASILLLNSVSEGVERVIGVAGGVYLVVLGLLEIRAARRAIAGSGLDESPPRDLWKGAATNFLNPQMWTFWVAVGAPIVTGAPGRLEAGMFLAGFYALLIGSKLALAVVIGRSRRVIVERGWIERLGVLGGLGLIAIGLVLAIGR